MIYKVDDIHKLTIKKYGNIEMINKTIQELQEFMEVLRDLKNGNPDYAAVKEESQDVKNMIKKIEIMFNFDPNELKKIRIEKMKRTLLRLKETTNIDITGI